LAGDQEVSLKEGVGTVVRLGANAVAAASVLGGKALIAVGLRRPPEGWRRTVGILLRSEPTRFALSAFALTVPAPDLAEALHAFLATEPDAHFSLEWRKPITSRRRNAFVDVTLLEFDDDGRLRRIRPMLSARGPSIPAPEITARVHDAIVAAYNRTSRLPEVERMPSLLRAVDDGIGSGGAAALDYSRRLLASCCLSIEQRDLTDASQRFCPPRFAARRTLGFGYLSFVARPAGGGAVDLWASAHHVGLDGVPLQDLLDRLERAWGTQPIAFPPASAGAPFVEPHPCHAPGERAVDLMTTFVDMAPVIALRRELNAKYSPAIGGEVTVGTLIAWLLSQEPEFEGVRIASTVDVAASEGYERDVDVVSLRPADFATRERPWGGFVEFAREFNRLIAASRTRTSPVRAGMQTAGLLPAWAHAAIVRSNPASLDETFGTLCVTIVRNARVFVAPMTDLGLRHGFFAIGNMNLPSQDGRAVTSVSMKGDAGRIASYPAILQRAIDRAATLQGVRRG
jgi:hypothetical protein